jgi:integrase
MDVIRSVINTMASVWRHPLSKYWTACFRDLAGQQRRITTKETDRKAAQRIAEEFEAAVRTKRTLRQAQLVLDRLQEEISGQTVQRKTLRTYCQEWLTTKEPETAPRTQVFYRTSTAKFIAFLGERAEVPLSELTKSDIVAYRNSLAKSLSARTTNQDLKVVRMLFKAAERDELIHQNPAQFVNTVRQRATNDKRPFTLAEIQAILSVADSEWQSLVRFGFYTGQRLGDLATLRWSNIDLIRSEIRFVTAKTGRRMIIPLSDGLRAHIASLAPSDQTDAVIHLRAFAILKAQGHPGTLSRQFGELLSEAGLRPSGTHQSTGKTRSSRRKLNALSFHSLRRTATTLLHEAGIAGAVAQALIGHDSEAIHEHYVNVGREALQKAAAVFPSI